MSRAIKDLIGFFVCLDMKQGKHNAPYVPALHCTILNCTVKYSTALYNNALHCTIIPCTSVYCTAATLLDGSQLSITLVMSCSAVVFTELPCNSPRCSKGRHVQCAGVMCSDLQSISMMWSDLQCCAVILSTCSAVMCSDLQRSAVSCSDNTLCKVFCSAVCSFQNVVRSVLWLLLCSA